MYSVDDRDSVVELVEIPRPSVGAPCPMVVASGAALSVAYYPRSADEVNASDEPVVLATFLHPYAHLFGPPNDEAFEGHPLAARGLNPYRVYEVRGSSWIRMLERMNSVHDLHKPEHFEAYRHFIFAFHDEIFECIARGVSTSHHRGRVAGVIRDLLS